jgi:hypothetical protein
MTQSGRRVGIATDEVNCRLLTARVGEQLINHFVGTHQQGRWHS